jgi:ribosomal protein S18 acetylase RimI-like enzyme
MNAKIEFTPLSHTHLPLLHKWLNIPHVKAWWDQDVQWTPALIEEKYDSYVEGYKVINGVKKPISTYIIYFNATPIGYIQYYNVYDFPRDDNVTLEGLPKNLAAIDLYIGEADFVGQGLGPLLIDQFLIHYVWKYFSACFVDVNTSNTQARRAYEKAGFKLIKAVANGKAIWMLRNKNERGETCIE